jgi:hypothetical protein
MSSKRKPAKAAEPEKAELQVTRESVERASGSRSEAFQQELFGQIVDTLWVPKQREQAKQLNLVQAAHDAMESIAPRDEVEAMLAAQMLSTHNAAMECMRRAMIPEQTFVGREQALKHGAKLMQLYERQMAALDKRRGQGQQKITVEHVTVEAGGQAIVGNVVAGGQPAPAAPAIAHTPQVPIEPPNLTEPARVRRQRGQ